MSSYYPPNWSCFLKELIFYNDKCGQSDFVEWLSSGCTGEISVACEIVLFNCPKKCHIISLFITHTTYHILLIAKASVIL